MKRVDCLREDLKHVRLISFSLLIISATTIYLVWSAWTDAPEVGEELRSLRQYLKDLQTAKENPQILTRIREDWASTQAESCKLRVA